MLVDCIDIDNISNNYNRLKMKNSLKLLLFSFTLIAVLSACNKKEEVEENNTPEKSTELKAMPIPTIKETFLSKWDENDNVDSPAFYITPSGEHWIIATGKSSHDLLIYNAENGELIKHVLKPGTNAGELQRPNGIWVIDNLCAVVERDNHRVQIFELPDFKSIGFIAADKLLNPYGLSIDKLDDHYRLFITDNYEKNDSIPPNEELGKRALEYTFAVKDGKLTSEFKRYIGETSGDGVLKIVESVYADPANNTLLFSEEDETDTYIKSYDLTKGTFDGRTLGRGIMNYQAEGIALYDCGNGEGFWFCTDQAKGDNTFYIFDRKTFKQVAAFKSETTQNTDGVWLTQQPYGNFKKGVFFAVNNDGGIGAFDIEMLFKKLKINCK